MLLRMASVKSKGLKRRSCSINKSTAVDVIKL